jgi:hypothetical protein
MEYGIAGTARSVVDGTAEFRIVETPSKTGPEDHATAMRTPGTRRIVANLPPGVDIADVDRTLLVPFRDLRVDEDGMIAGPFVEAVKGTQGKVARISVKEGLWEVPRGVKIDGGERRRAEVRALRRSKEKKER